VMEHPVSGGQPTDPQPDDPNPDIEPDPID
jgi:hypothetical protein